MSNNSKLWHSSTADSLHSLIEEYTTGDDQIYDQQLFGYDLTATKAHAHMLQEINILTNKEYESLANEIDSLFERWSNSEMIVDDRYEDGHTALETLLTSKLGDIGKKVHTGRSRNDQALVMMRLYLKDQLDKISSELMRVVESYGTTIEVLGSQDMPGYTHMQRAMPSTVEMWLGSYKDAFADLVQYAIATKKIIDQNPLGSAAGFGVDLALDREMTTGELGFSKIQENPMYCGLSRGLFELMAVQSLNPIMSLVGKFSSDMLLFTSQEFDFFRLPKNMTTGSSIMPHKRNYDVFEIMRANSHMFPSYSQSLQSLVTGVGSGYHRDLQQTKGITIRAFITALSTLDVLSLCLKHLSINKPALDAAMTDEMYTVAEINKLVEQGIPFRDAYQKVKRSLKQ